MGHCRCIHKALLTRMLRTRRVFELERTYLLNWRALSTDSEKIRVKAVYVSQSEDIFENLALEDWFYRNGNFLSQPKLLLWRNKSALVIGRHQNLWMEVDVTEAERLKVAVARRNSGGGTVYHDRGNLNCTFFTSREEYNRRLNLTIIQRALQRFGISVHINSKDDLTLNGAKISGTASKLGKSAYHHCTLLVDSDLQKLSVLLNPNTTGIESNATKSTKSLVTNIKMERTDDVSVESALFAIGQEFLQTNSNGEDGGEKIFSKQRGFQFVNPTEDWFPGLGVIKDGFQSWAWIGGKTPDFSLKRAFCCPLSGQRLDMEFKVSKGHITSASLIHHSSLIQHSLLPLLSSFQGRQFSLQILNLVEDFLSRESKRQTGST